MNRRVSPTKTPEYLAAGRPVVSTSIRDVVRPYGDAGLVRIADTPGEFVRAAEAAMAEDAGSGWLARVDKFLAGNSWDETWGQMSRRINEVVASRGNRSRRAGRGRRRRGRAGHQFRYHYSAYAEPGGSKCSTI
jgi:UDP-galactopyranose mutase